MGGIEDGNNLVHVSSAAVACVGRGIIQGRSVNKIFKIIVGCAFCFVTAGLVGCTETKPTSGKMEDGKMKDGKMKDGKMEDGKMKDGKMEGKMEDGKMKDGKMEEGKMKGDK